MKITGKDRTEIASVVLYLTPAEARELRDAAEEVAAHANDPDWHVHVSSADYQTEVTLTHEIAE